ncbi:magnesium transporter MRS2-F-like isoform X2 [Magnolia sinica]|uniref:magnesium transporter MRS2-F-like isoform X2 n=1 Tax=Magnolia sinica TaxID=86752 RepID=UPI00265A1801|nr:magnesium transporter MRS2-F-like isoform X2 [Magnolia sinica]
MRFRDISIKADRIAPVSPLSPSQQQTRRKSAVTKAWFVVSDSGESRIEEVGKYSIMRRTGLPARDLRILDPMLSYPSTVLGRERAIVVNLEDIKAIITATEVLVLSSKSPSVSALVEDLQDHVLNLHRTPRQAAESSDTDMGVTNKGPRYSPSFLSHRKPESPSSMGISQQRHVSLENSMMIPEMKDCSPRSELDGPKDGCPKMLPFEFRVLEGCLQSACKCLESETSMLEKETYPALDELTSKMSTLNLERVRQIKSRLVTISGRVQKVRDELEHLLDDDMDMAGMYLTDKLDHQQNEETSSTDEVDDDAFKIDDERDEDSKSKAKSSYVSLNGFKPNIEELEMLLEAYFTQIEGTLSKLSTLREYVDDTEDYVNLTLDDKQNKLLQMAVMINTAIVVLTLADITMAVLSMNIQIKIFDATQPQFVEMAFGIVGCCVVLYIIAIGLGKKTGLLG